jgi:hypothetical protein
LHFERKISEKEKVARHIPMEAQDGKVLKIS